MGHAADAGMANGVDHAWVLSDGCTNSIGYNIQPAGSGRVVGTLCLASASLEGPNRDAFMAV